MVSLELQATPRWRRRVAVVLATVFGVLVLLPAQWASAHAYLTDSNPADGSVLSSAPKQLRLAFSESVVPGATSLELVDANGAGFTPTRLRLVTAGADAGTEEPSALVADLPPLPRNAYRLSWRTLSSDDLHRTSGVIVFGVGRQVTGAGTAEPTPPPGEATLRWVLFTAVATALGGVLAQRMYRAANAAPPVVRRAARLCQAGCAAAATAAGLLLFRQLHASGVPLTATLDGRYGLGWIAREIALIVLAATAARAGHSRGAGGPARGPALVAGSAAFVVAVGSALTGHSSAAGLTALAVGAAHLTAAGIWVGGLGCLLVAGLPAVRQPADRAAVRAAFIAFARPAAWSAVVLLATGIYLVSGSVGSVDAALGTTYGRVLLAKIALFAVALLLGWVNHRRLRSPGQTGVPRRGIAVEAIVGLMILALVGVLTSAQPALEPQFIRAPAAAAPPALDAPAADLQQTLAVRPDQPGRNLILLEVANTRRPAPGPITGVSVQIASAGNRQAGPSIAAQPLTDGQWSAAVNLPADGPAQLWVTVHRAGLPDVRSRFTWHINPAAVPGHQRVVLSQAPIRAPAKAVGIGLMLASLLALGVHGLRTRRRTRRQRGDRAIPPAAVEAKAGATELVHTIDG